MKDWDALYEECIHCQKCGLAETRTNVVFGEGDRDAEVMFIGEGPGGKGVVPLLAVGAEKEHQRGLGDEGLVVAGVGQRVLDGLVGNV